MIGSIAACGTGSSGTKNLRKLMILACVSSAPTVRGAWLRSLYRFAPKAIRSVIVDHSDRLHPGINNDWTDELEPTVFQCFRKARGNRRLCRHWTVVHNLPMVDEAPDKVRKVIAFLLHIEEYLRPGDGGPDLALGADDGGVSHESCDFSLPVVGNLLWTKVVEGLSERLALVQDRKPREASLKPAQHE